MTVPDSTQTPNSVKSAAELLARFSRGDPISDNTPFSHEPAVVVAAQLLAIAAQLERIADAMPPAAAATADDFAATYRAAARAALTPQEVQP